LYGGVYDFTIKIIEDGDIEVLRWASDLFDHYWQHYNYIGNYDSMPWRVYEINDFIELSVKKGHLEIFKWFDARYIGGRNKKIYEYLSSFNTPNIELSNHIQYLLFESEISSQNTRSTNTGGINTEI
jgi:hypothetical protein